MLQKFGLIIPKNVEFPDTLDTWVWLSGGLLFTIHSSASEARTSHETSGKHFLIIFSSALDSPPILNNAWQMQKYTSTAYKPAVIFLCILNSIDISSHIPGQEGAWDALFFCSSWLYILDINK